MDVTETKSLLIAEFRSIASGYKWTEALVRHLGLSILEATPMAPGKFVALFQGEKDVCEKAYMFLRNNSEGLLDSGMIDFLSEQTLPALYQLRKESLDDGFMVLETDSVTAALMSANLCALRSDLKLIEIRIHRGLGGRCLAFVGGPGPSLKRAQTQVEDLCRETRRILRTEVIETPHPKFLEFFG